MSSAKTLGGTSELNHPPPPSPHPTPLGLIFDVAILHSILGVVSVNTLFEVKTKKLPC